LRVELDRLVELRAPRWLLRRDEQERLQAEVRLEFVREAVAEAHLGVRERVERVLRVRDRVDLDALAAAREERAGAVVADVRDDAAAGGAREERDLLAVPDRQVGADREAGEAKAIRALAADGGLVHRGDDARGAVRDVLP